MRLLMSLFFHISKNSSSMSSVWMLAGGSLNMTTASILFLSKMLQAWRAVQDSNQTPERDSKAKRCSLSGDDQRMTRSFHSIQRSFCHAHLIKLQAQRLQMGTTGLQVDRKKMKINEVCTLVLWSCTVHLSRRKNASETTLFLSVCLLFAA